MTDAEKKDLALKIMNRDGFFHLSPWAMLLTERGIPSEAIADVYEIIAQSLRQCEQEFSRAAKAVREEIVRQSLNRRDK